MVVSFGLQDELVGWMVISLGLQDELYGWMVVSLGLQDELYCWMGIVYHYEAAICCIHSIELVDATKSLPQSWTP